MDRFISAMHEINEKNRPVYNDLKDDTSRLARGDITMQHTDAALCHTNNIIFCDICYYICCDKCCFSFVYPIFLQGVVSLNCQSLFN